MLLKSLGELSQHLCLVSMDPGKGAGSVGAGKGHQTEQRTVQTHFVPHPNPTASPQRMNDSNSTGVKQSFTSLFPIILSVKDTNASWESKRKLNTGLSPSLDLLSWRTVAITNAFSYSSRNICSAKGLSQLSAGYCEGWFLPAELH